MPDSSSHSIFAIFRGHPHQDLADLGEQHLQRDLNASDRRLLREAAGNVSLHTTLGSLLGLGLGLWTAYRIRANRVALYNAFRIGVNRPTELIFASGRREPVPDLEPYLRPTTWGDVATYAAFATGGLFLGGETGFLTGTAAATRTITKDPASRARIEKAFRLFQADILRRELHSLETDMKETDEWAADESSWDKLKSQASGLANSLKSH
ncbi:hypothetical protein B0T17DRAFT_603728 [Bombardia bombarda]|uniref:Uncharacterized protein n=1 Tax=Bombardia bombarda TaxID=252184 RepID=A0AA39W9L3_9PEZI|nr:hypothetical protein B0T17DRAFT_603728 [Bombardia bombarda]